MSGLPGTTINFDLTLKKKVSLILLLKLREMNSLHLSRVPMQMLPTMSTKPGLILTCANGLSTTVSSRLSLQKPVMIFWALWTRITTLHEIPLTIPGPNLNLGNGPFHVVSLTARLPRLRMSKLLLKLHCDRWPHLTCAGYSFSFSLLYLRLVKLAEDNYYSLRDNAYQTWDDNTIRNWLEKKGYVKTPVEAKRDDLLATIKNYWYTANDRVSWATILLWNLSFCTSSRLITVSFLDLGHMVRCSSSCLPC